MIKTTILILLAFAINTSTFAQNEKRIYGPVIEDYGSTFAVKDPAFKTDPNKVYKVVFDVHNTMPDSSMVSPMLNTLARFINMHVQAGVPLENLKVAAVMHNKGSKDALNNKAYRKRFGIDNPNVPLMEALEAAGADIYMCGQSLSARGIAPKELADPVQTALSAMTVILSLENEGYHLIKF